MNHMEGLTAIITNQMALILAVGIASLIAIAAVGVIVFRQRRSHHLRQHFGSEYNLAVVRRGDPEKAELELLNREKRVHSFTIKPLPPAAHDRFVGEWSVVQQRFVDDPVIAVTDADSLVTRVMAARGYPISDFEQRAADISVNYPIVVQNFRAARAIAERHARGAAGAEDLRQAMIYYRTLFDELLDIPESAPRYRHAS
jgi:hypothetical protein